MHFYKYLDGNTFKNIFCSTIVPYFNENVEYINNLNVFPVPDGDTGTNMNLTLKSSLKKIQDIDSNNIGIIIKKISRGMLLGARGNSGVILSQIWRGISQYIDEKEIITTEDFLKALIKGKEAAYSSVMRPIEGTILTIIKDISSISDIDEDFIIFFEKLISIGNISLKKTKELLPILKEVDVVDSGAQGFMIILEGLLYGLKGVKPEVKNTKDNIKKIENLFNHDHVENDDYGYCTEFIVRLNNKKDFNKEKYLSKLDKLGTSVVMVNDDDILKVHIHTLEPINIFNDIISMGEIILLKAENMREQVETNISNKNIPCKTALVTIVDGKGIEKCFNDLNVPIIIQGGSSFNPSSEEILNYINNVQADEYIILPNNSNAILAAEQVKLLTDKTIHVLPAKTIPQGISAAIVYDNEKNAKDNLRVMNESILSVESAVITKSVRNTNLNNVSIIKDHFIGINNKNIICCHPDILETIQDTINQILTDEMEVLTLYEGKNNKNKDLKNIIINALQKKFPNLEINYIYGGQDIYDFLISLE